MISNTRNRSNYTTESQKEKKTCFNALAGVKWNLNVQYVQTNLKDVYYWNKMWSLKSLVRVELVYMQYNISDSQVLFWCSVFIILEIASLDTLFLCSEGQQAWLCY